LQALRYIKPPDSLLTQLDVYTEEKFEDEEDMHERPRALKGHGVGGHARTTSDSEVVLEDLISLAKKHGELYPMMVEILNHYGQILQRDIGMCVQVRSVFNPLTTVPVSSRPTCLLFWIVLWNKQHCWTTCKLVILISVKIARHHIVVQR
jgi:hypothetical protein